MRGHLKQRSKGSWAIWLELDRDPVTGKRRQKTLTVKGTKKMAEAKLAEGHANSTVPNAVDQRIAGKHLGDSFESVRHLTEKGREAASLNLPVSAGTRVSFAGSLGALLTYDNPPVKGAVGEVVNVKSANGDVTAHNGKVFVKWDDGEFLPIHAVHLRLANKKKIRTGRMVTKDPTDFLGRISSGVTTIRVASLGDISSFLKVADGTLVHKSTNDLWSFTKDADGGLIVERLFDDNGQPLKG